MSKDIVGVRWILKILVFYPIPQDPVTRETYMKCIEAANPSELAKNHKRGLGGPQTFMPILAKYVQTGEKIWGDAVSDLGKI